MHTQPTPTTADVSETTLTPQPVVFRRFRDGDIIALLPTDSDRAGFCASFEHIGQHSEARYALVVRVTTPATPAEYADLKAELEGYPYHYKLRVMQRHPNPKPATR